MTPHRNLTFLFFLCLLLIYTIVINITLPTSSVLEPHITAQEYTRAQFVRYNYTNKSKASSVMQTVIYPKALKRDYWTNINKNQLILNSTNNNITFCIQLDGAFSTVKFDGFGAQATAICAAIAYYHKHSDVVDFYYTPMRNNQHHGFVGLIMDNFLHFDLEFNEKLKKLDDIKENITYLKLIPIVERNPSYYYDIQRLHIFHENYMLNKEYYNISYIQNTHNFNIAVHIRRGDIINNRDRARFLSNFHYIQIMKDILNQIKLNKMDLHQKQHVAFNIFSQFNFDQNDFNEKAQTYLSVDSHTDFDIEYFIDVALKDTVHALVISDALIMSKSSLSYLAALLTESKYIYYTEYRSKPLNNWNVVQNKNINKDGLWFRWWSKHNCSQDNITHIGNITIFRNIHCQKDNKEIEEDNKLCSTRNILQKYKFSDWNQRD